METLIIIKNNLNTACWRGIRPAILYSLPFHSLEIRKLERWEILMNTKEYQKARSKYSCPNLVSPKSEEPISRPFVGEIQFRLVLQKRMGTSLQ